MEPDEFRRALGSFATGVTIVTTLSPEGERVGITVNSLTSVSLDPPLLLFCVGKAALSFPSFVAASYFAVNVLAEQQRSLSNRFARSLGDKWSGVMSDRGTEGVPLLHGALAKIECRRHAVHDAGDHVIVVGEVRSMSVNDDLRPLLFFRGSYLALTRASEEIEATPDSVVEFFGWGG